MIFKRTATGVDNRDLKCISFALEIQGIIFYFSNFCASISSSDFLQKKKKNWFREKNEGWETEELARRVTLWRSRGRWWVTGLHGVESMPAKLILGFGRCSFPGKGSLAYLEKRQSQSLYQFHTLLLSQAPRLVISHVRGNSQQAFHCGGRMSVANSTRALMGSGWGWRIDSHTHGQQSAALTHQN